MEQDLDINLNQCLFDSHTHLLDYAPQQLTQIINSASQASVNFISACTTRQKQYEPMIELFQKYSLPLKKNQNFSQMHVSQGKVTVIPSFGVHPCFIQHQNENTKWSQHLQNIISQNQLFGVGEIGLDFRTNTLETSTKESQNHFFKIQFETALKFNRVVTVHCVRAYGEMLKFFKKYNKSIENQKKKKVQTAQLGFAYQQTPIIMHSYGGSKEITQALLKLTHLNIYFSLSLKRSEQLCNVIPLDKLLLETDAPHQPNYPLLLKEKIVPENIHEHQRADLQKKNRVHFVKVNYSSLHSCYSISQGQFTRAILKNSLKAFRLLV